MSDIFVANTQSAETPEKVEVSKKSDYASKLSAEAGGAGSVHLFTSYCESPDDISFENQDEDETVLLFIRKDVITNLPWMLIGIIMLIAPVIIMPLLSLLHLPPLHFPQNYTFVISIYYYLLVTIFLFINFITWYFNLNLVTEKRVVDINFQGIVYKEVSATKISLVQDVSYTQVGVIRTIFDYGDVLVQTAGTIDNFTFEAVPRPDDVVHAVENLIGKRNV